MKKFILPILLLMAASSIIAYNSIDEDNTGEDIALASAAKRGSIYSISTVSEPVKDRAVNFSWKNEKGKKINFAEYTKGKVVFLNFWGTWCPPCRREIPDIVSIGNDLKDKDFVIIGVAMERGSKPEKKLAAFMEANEMNYHNFLANSELKAAYGGISAVPTTFIIDKKGKIVEQIVGMRSKEAFMKSINKVIK